jgi:hypothetical protein
METKIKVTSMTHKELVDLLATALYGSQWFTASYDRKIYESLACVTGECFEDKLADMLLAGHKISITDVEADGEKHSDKFVRFEGRFDDAVYEVGLSDFLEVASTKKGYELVCEVLSGDGDYYTADSFLQRVVFGEEIYG